MKCNMKYLKRYTNFLKPLLEEVEVKYSQSMYDWLMNSKIKTSDKL